jgi:hypothetical protein
MTIPEAYEQLELLTAKLSSCPSDLQRPQIEAQIARCYRIIQRAQQRAHKSLVSVAGILLDLQNELSLTPNQLKTITVAAEFIHRATTEQLAIAVPAAIADHSMNAPLSSIRECDEMNAILRLLHSSSHSYEHRLAIRTVLKLFTIAEKSQIKQLSRRFSGANSIESSRILMSATTVMRVA